MTAGIPAATFCCCFFRTQTVLFLEAVQNLRHGPERDIERLRDCFFRLTIPRKIGDNPIPRRSITGLLVCPKVNAIKVPLDQIQPFIPGKRTSDQPFSPSRFVSYRRRRSYGLKALCRFVETSVYTFWKSFMPLRSFWKGLPEREAP